MGKRSTLRFERYIAGLSVDGKGLSETQIVHSFFFRFGALFCYFEVDQSWHFHLRCYYNTWRCIFSTVSWLLNVRAVLSEWRRHGQNNAHLCFLCRHLRLL